MIPTWLKAVTVTAKLILKTFKSVCNGEGTAFSTPTPLRGRATCLSSPKVDIGRTTVLCLLTSFKASETESEATYTLGFSHSEAQGKEQEYGISIPEKGLRIVRKYLRS